MSAGGMTRTVLATQLAAAIAKDAAAGQIGLVAHEFGPQVRGWLGEVAACLAPAAQKNAPAVAAPGANVDPQGLDSERVCIFSKLRGAGYAVVVFDPEELQGVAAHVLEERLVAEGNDVIELIKPAPARDRTT